MIDATEIEVTLVRLQGGKRLVRLVHLPTATTVEGDLEIEESLVTRKNKLLEELQRRVTPSAAKVSRGDDSMMSNPESK